LAESAWSRWSGESFAATAVVYSERKSCSSCVAALFPAARAHTARVRKEEKNSDVSATRWMQENHETVMVSTARQARVHAI
jgi:hypothetical protein